MRSFRYQRGVTLIELLVVLAILALMAGSVAFNLPPAHDDAKREAERFAALIDAASAASIADGRPIRVEVGRSGYFFQSFERGEWRPVDLPTLAARSLDGVVIEVALEDAALKNEPPVRDAAKDDFRRILLDPIGASDAFTADFESRHEVWRVKRTTDGLLEVSEHARS